MSKSEKEIQTEILDYLKVRGIYCWRNNSGVASYGKRKVAFGKVGSSDIIGITKDGRFLAIEVKEEKGKPSQKQLDFIEAINDNGGLAFVARSVGDVQREGV